MGQRCGRNAFWRMGVLRRLAWPVVGTAALVWFLVRVIPKPSRAAYPCQRTAMPLASSFVVWLIGLASSARLLRRGKARSARGRLIITTVVLGICVGILWSCLSITSPRPARAEEPERNKPVGVGKGVFPGRVVWAHDPNATDWKGPWEDDGHPWQAEHTSQTAVDRTMSRAIRSLGGKADDKQAWDAILKYFNKQRGKGEVCYKKGEKIAVKINLTTCNYNAEFWNVDPETLEKTGQRDNSDTSPQMIVALLRQLVRTVGVQERDISIVDTLAYFPKQYWDICHGEFPEVRYVDSMGKLGRFKAEPSGIVQHWSSEEAKEYKADHICASFAEAEYIVNMAVLKSHDRAGITLCGKNHYGSYVRRPIAWEYFNLHDSLAGYNPAKATYRAIVDIMGHPHMGGKTILYVIDGLYGGYNWEADPVKWKMSPFNGDWPSSIFVSQDPVAIDCVGLDFLWEEWPEIVRMEGVDDYLIKAAEAEAFYDPDGDGREIESLGVYERWNNPEDKKYSRNLETGDGIELVCLK